MIELKCEMGEWMRGVGLVCGFTYSVTRRSSFCVNWARGPAGVEILVNARPSSMDLISSDRSVEPGRSDFYLRTKKTLTFHLDQFARRFGIGLHGV
jgi:hypothetical protein